MVVIEMAKNYIIFVLAICITTLSAIAVKLFALENKEPKVSVLVYNLGSCLVWPIILIPLLVINPLSVITPLSVIFGIIYGVVLFLFLVLGLRSQETGPYTLTRLMTCPSFIIATVFGIIYCKEGVTVGQIIGMALICCAMYMCINPRFTAEKVSLRWFMYSFGYMLINGFIGIIYKLFGRVSDGNDYDAMLLFASMTAIVLYLGLIVFKKVRYSEKIILPKGRLLGLTLFSGVLACVFIRLNVYLAAVIPSVIMFPVSNISAILLSAFVGRFLFKDKLNAIQLCGMGVGIVAILVMV